MVTVCRSIRMWHVTILIWHPPPVVLEQCYVDNKKAARFPCGDSIEKEDSWTCHVDRTISGALSMVLRVRKSNDGFLDNIFGIALLSHKNQQGEDWTTPLLASKIQTFLLSDKVMGKGLGRGKPKLSLQNWRVRGIMTRSSSNLPTQKNTVFKGTHLSHLKIFGVSFSFPLKHNELVRVSMVTTGCHGNW